MRSWAIEVGNLRWQVLPLRVFAFGIGDEGIGLVDGIGRAGSSPRRVRANRWNVCRSFNTF